MSDFNKYFKNPPNPYWIASTEETGFPCLDGDVTVDVAVVGGGLVGIMSAYLLKKEGLRVAVIEADRILMGTTGHSTSKLTSQHTLIYDKIKRQFGNEMAKQYADANEGAIQLVWDLVKEKNIDCDFIPQPAYVYTLQEKYVNKIQKEVEAAASVGIKASYLSKIPLPFKIMGAMKFENQAQFHVRKFLLALAKEIPNDGSYIFEETKAVDIEEGSTCKVITENGKKVSASNVIVASHYPFYDGEGLYFTRIYQEKSYIIGVKAKEKYPGGMYVTAESPGRSLRNQPDGDGEIILVAGENHKTGHGEDTNTHYLNLINFAKDIFQIEDIPYRWSTQDCTTIDDVPYVGYIKAKTKNIFIATGFRKWGMTNGIASAMILKDIITKGESSWQCVYNPSRFTTSAAILSFIVQNADVAANYISGKLSIAPNNVEIKNGEAKVINVDGQRIGAYKDENGKLHMVDITCTHLGCELKWNDAEKCWDCPCHGSRFSYDGDIIEGPAINRLNYADEGRNTVEPNIFK